MHGPCPMFERVYGKPPNPLAPFPASAASESGKGARGLGFRKHSKRARVHMDHARCLLTGIALAIVLLTGLAGAALAQTQPADDAEFFEKRVRPILAASCFNC